MIPQLAIPLTISLFLVLLTVFIVKHDRPSPDHLGRVMVLFYGTIAFIGILIVWLVFFALV